MNVRISSDALLVSFLIYDFDRCPMRLHQNYLQKLKVLQVLKSTRVSPITNAGTLRYSQQITLCRWTIDFRTSMLASEVIPPVRNYTQLKFRRLRLPNQLFIGENKGRLKSCPHKPERDFALLHVVANYIRSQKSKPNFGIQALPRQNFVAELRYR